MKKAKKYVILQNEGDIPHYLKKEDRRMWIFVITLLIFWGVCYAFFRFAWAISKPIFVYIYERMVNAIMQQGISEQAAKALISAIAILLIVLIILCSY